ncbi:MAG: hypothetical protein QOJ90_3120 [Actinomycetota bacterium]|nr:hypothetical protein [Actinomycetota bacterium]
MRCCPGSRDGNRGSDGWGQLQPLVLPQPSQT